MKRQAPIRIAINGFGRIGRSLLRVLLDHSRLKIVHVNDPMDAEQAAYLLRYDTVMGRLKESVEINGKRLRVGKLDIAMTHERQASSLDWRKLGVDYIVNSSGANNDRKSLDAMIRHGAKRVFISAPAPKVADRHILAGVNDGDLDPGDRIISGGSCTAHCFAPVIKIIGAAYCIERGFMQTVHSYTSAQNLTDGAHPRDKRRGRAAAMNIVPTTTEAVHAFEAALPKMKGLLMGMAMRVPVATGSNIDLVLQLNKPARREDINALLEGASAGKYKNIVEYSADPL
ncbi:MAG: type I glyceraldehyde-3-phosphate dehydrogenase, partial [Planctomycetes bacterium]|nr:type I glyceraldehyde-3-phosphate dehydrogenase [Planctomycetota bacterium]